MIIRKEGIKYDLKEKGKLDVEGAEVEWIFYHNNEKPSMALRRYKIRKGGYIGNHSHPWEHIIVVLRGRAEVTSGDRKAIVEAGDHIYIPANEEHGFRNIGDEDAEFYCIINCIGGNCIP